MKLKPLSLELLGGLCIFTSAIFFYLSAVTIRWAASAVELEASFFVFIRFFAGFFTASLFFLFTQKKPTANNFKWIANRTMTNVIAVYCFFNAVSETTAAEANVLNMTYPIFIAMISWFFLRQQNHKSTYLFLFLSLIGIWLVLFPQEIQWNWNQSWGLFSGIFASLSIISLNISRQYDDTNVILWYMFLAGTVMIFAFSYQDIYWPSALEAYYLGLCGAFGVIGQYFLTAGLKHVTPLESSIISSTRILIAVMLGPMIALEPELSWKGWLGAILIFIANVGLAHAKHRSLSSIPHSPVQ